MSDEINNTDDILDVRDIIERYEELENLDIEDEQVDRQAVQDELKYLGDLLEELKGNGGDEQWRGDWYPVTLINRNYFEDYARELASDVVEGYDERNEVWPFTFIDWGAAAEALEQDYSTVDFGGEEYLYR